MIKNYSQIAKCYYAGALSNGHLKFCPFVGLCSVKARTHYVVDTLSLRDIVADILSVLTF